MANSKLQWEDLEAFTTKGARELKPTVHISGAGILTLNKGFLQVAKEWFDNKNLV